MQLTINQLRAQIAEAKAAHEVQLVEARRAEQGRGDGVEAHGQHELAALPAAQATDGIVQVACLAAELRLEELTAVAAREEAERQREAARIARAELRTQMQMLRTQVATSTEADARLVELEEEVAAGEAQLVELRAKLAARPASAPATTDWKEATAEGGRTYYYDTTNPQATSWSNPPALQAPAGSGGSPAPKVALSEAAQDELGALRAQNAKLQRQLATASAKLRAACSALSEQQQQVADAMSIGSTKCLQAALHGWLLHLLSMYWRVWSGAAREGAQHFLGRSAEPVRQQALRGWLGRWEASGAMHALLKWREVAVVLAGRRQLHLARELLSAQQEQWQDAMMANGAARLENILAASRLTPLPVAFALWRALALDRARIIPVHGGGAAGAVLAAQLDDERAQTAQATQAAELRAQEGAPTAREQASQAAATPGATPWEGIAGLDAAVYAGFASTQAAVAEAKQSADRERVAMRQALLQRGGALPAAAAASASPTAPGTPHSQWELQQELNTVRRHASEVESARSSALQSQRVATAAAADVQRVSSAALSEVAQLRQQLHDARGAAAREAQQRRANTVRQLRFGGPADEPARRAMQCASSVLLRDSSGASARARAHGGAMGRAPTPVTPHWPTNRSAASRLLSPQPAW